TARDFADELGIVGWVKNLPDGSVQMVAEGQEVVLDDFVRKLESYFSVRDKKVVRTVARGDFKDFEITH
ncbi:MAG: acylphosphatase, partial [Candidatus Omnitrophica bacterium]|nr:acylphosphatase [Candidatus Omnitrophota bacterium]